MTAPAPPRLDQSAGTAAPQQETLARAASAVLHATNAQLALLAEFEAISTSIAEAAGLEDPGALERLMVMRQDIIERLELEVEASRVDREVLEAGRHLLAPEVGREVDGHIARLRGIVASIAERDLEDRQRLIGVRDAAWRELAEISASGRAIRSYGGPRETGPTFQDRSA